MAEMGNEKILITSSTYRFPGKLPYIVALDSYINFPNKCS